MYRPARRLAEIEPFHVVELLTRARQLEADGRDIIHMEVGEPDFPTPEPIANAAVDAIKRAKTLYTQALGLPELRQAISDFYRQRYGAVVPASRVAVTNGASGALNLAFACLADPGSGKVNAYATAYIFFVLPHGLLAMSIVTTFTPEMATSVKRKDKAAFIDRTTSGVRLIALLTLPAAAGMFVLRRALVGLLQRGNYDPADALLTSRAMAGFALGLVGFSVYLFVLRAFYVHTDARTPFMINLGENAINIVLAFALVGRFGVLGLAASFAIAYLVSSAWSLQVLSYKVPGFSVRAVTHNLWRMLLAAVVMAEVMWAVARLVGGNEGLGALLRVGAAGVVGIGVYLALLTLMGVPELAQLRSRLGARFA